MDIDQKNIPGTANVVIRKSNPASIIIFILIGVVIGSVIAVAFFLSRAEKAEIDTVIVPRADQSKQPKGSTPDVSNVEKILMSIEVPNFSGIVTAIENNSISVKTSFFGEEKNFKVLIDKDTKIFKTGDSQPSVEGENKNSVISESPAKISDIKKGDGAFVDAGENIKDKTEFVAKSITIFYYPPLPSPPPAPTMQK